MRLLSSILALTLALGCAGRAVSPGSPATEAAASPAQQTTAGGGPDTSADPPLPVDPATRVRTLPNGLRYYLRQHKEPQKRASLRLAVNAGSVLETDQEQGLAHFVEHMAFNGTRLFGKQQLVDYIEKVGMRFGQHANASTSFDETIYMFDVPTDDPAVLEKGLLILQQIASDVSFDPQEVQRERGVLIEEWRLGRGASMRVMEKILPVVFKGSRYAERLPIGKKEILERTTAEDLRAFYKRWYRPDLMAVMAVGDFDVDKVEATLKKLFEPLPRPAEAASRPEFPVPDHQETLVAQAKDKELPATSVGVFYKLPRRPTLSKGDYRRHVVEAMYHNMVNGRLEELTRASDPPFLGAGSTTQPLVRSKDMFLQVAAVKQDGVVRGLESLTREVERVDRHGFTTGELDRGKTDLLRQMERAVREKDKVHSAGYADEMVRNFLRQESMPGIERELELTREFLPGVSIEEMNRLASEWITERNRVILVQGPEATPVPPPGELLSLFQRVEKEQIPAYVDKVTAGPLVAALPAGKPVKRQKPIAELGVTEWRLGNGVRVVVKPTDFKNDEILMSALSPGGHSLVPDRDYESAVYAADVVASSGVGSFGPTELRKALSGKVVSISPHIGELEEGVSGSASPDDLETLLQLTYLFMTQPRRDPEVFAAWKAQLAEQVARRLADPQTVFWDKWRKVYFGDHPRRRPPDASTVGKVNLDTIHRVYKARFADAGDFTFVFVGRVDLARLKPLAEKYLGALPSKDQGNSRRERWRDVGARPRGNGKRIEHQGGVEPKALVAMAFTGSEPYSRERQHRIDSVSEALSIRLREVLREDLGGTYTVGVDGDLIRWPQPFYRANVRFSCSPDNIAKLTDAVYSEIRAAKAKGFGEDYLTKVKAAQRRSLEESVRTNGYWLGWLTEHYRAGTDPRAVLDEPKLIDSLDGAALQAAARRYFDDKQQMVGVWKPAGGAPAAAADPVRGRRSRGPTLSPQPRGHMLVRGSGVGIAVQGGSP